LKTASDVSAARRSTPSERSACASKKTMETEEMKLDFKEIAARWAEQYADRPDGLAIKDWAEMMSDNFMYGYTERVDPEPTESDFAKWIDGMFPHVEDFGDGSPTHFTWKKATCH
jgi:hypothetical protein